MTFFEQFVSWIGVTPVLREVLGSDITPFGSWYFPEIAMLVMVMTLLAASSCATRPIRSSTR
ncbi:MAG: hypothetical protein ACLSVD_06375 [Eggerthellaceae bacterium]